MNHHGKINKSNVFNNLGRGLACAAVNSSLESVLILDSSVADIEILSLLFQKFIQAANEAETELVYIPSDATEDMLWGQISLRSRIPQDKGQPSHLSHRALFFPEEDESKKLRLVVIPDLSRLANPARRALITLVGAPSVQVERNGLSRSLRPRLKYLAFCQTASIPAVSRHLLDRFSIRLDAGRWQSPDNERKKSILKSVRQAKEMSYDSIAPFAETMVGKIRRGITSRPAVSDKVLDFVIKLSEEFKTQGHRREIALLQMALAMAKLEAKPQVTSRHVLKAAELQGLLPVKTGLTSPGETLKDALRDARGERLTLGAKARSEPAVSAGQKKAADEAGVSESSKLTAPLVAASDNEFSGLATSSITYNFRTEITGYVEDNLPVEPLLATLQPFQSKSSMAHARGGHIIGSTHTNQLKDISFIDTIRAAIPFQHLRGRISDAPLIIERRDLRRYMRAQTPHLLFILIVDLSDSVGVDWTQALLDEFELAYKNRSPITLITAGAKKNEELTACLEAVESKRITAIQAFLRQKSGHSSPLAHALSLGLQQIDRTSTHGRNVINKIRLVIATDGRANVPLSFISEGISQPPSGLQGFKDALFIAGQIKTRSKVRSHVLIPKNIPHQELALGLAMALDAETRFVNSERKNA